MLYVIIGVLIGARPVRRCNVGQSLEVYEVEGHSGEARKAGPGGAAQAVEGEETKRRGERRW